MYYQADGMATYWVQGKLTHRLDKYKVAKASNFVRNRFKVEQVKVITCWGVRGEIPETFIINLSRSTLWSLGTETLVTTKKDEVITCKEDEVYETFDETDETTNETSTNDETRPPNLLVTKQNMNESDSECLAESDVEDETDVQEIHSCDKDLKEEILEQHESGATPGDILWTLKNERLKERKNSHKEEQSEDIMKSFDRVPKKELSGKNDSRNHEILLPRLVESDKEDKTDDEEEHRKEELQHDKEEEKNDSRSAPQNTSLTLRNGSFVEKKREKRDMINQNNVTFSTFRTPKNAIEGDLLVFPYSNLWFQGRLACRFDRLEDAIRSEWKTNRFKIEDIRATDDLNNSGLLPTAAIFNLMIQSPTNLSIHPPIK